MRRLVVLISVVGFTALAVLTPVGAVVVRLSEKLPVLLAVLLAAVFVRLARGMPPIPHEKIHASKAKIATQAFRKLVSAYVQTFVIFILAILVNLGFASLEPAELAALPKYVSGILAFMDALVILSIVFLVASDVTLARIQADLIDEVTSNSSTTQASNDAAGVRAAFENKDKGKPKVTRL